MLGLGAFAVPLVSTKFAASAHWSLHYLTSIGVASTCIVCSALVFRFKKQDGAHTTRAVRSPHVANRVLIPDILEEIGQPPKERSTSEQNYYRQIINQRAVHTMAFFILIYIG